MITIMTMVMTADPGYVLVDNPVTGHREIVVTECKKVVFVCERCYRKWCQKFLSKGQKCPAIVDRALLIKPWEIFLRFLTTNPDSSGNWKCLFENDGGKNSFESAPIIYWLLSQSNRPLCLNCSNSEFCENNWKLWSDCSTLPKWTRVNTKLKQQTSLNILRLLPGLEPVDWGRQRSFSKKGKGTF